MDYSGLSGTINWLILILERIKNYKAEAKDNTLPCKNNKFFKKNKETTMARLEKPQSQIRNTQQCSAER